MLWTEVFSTCIKLTFILVQKINNVSIFTKLMLLLNHAKWLNSLSPKKSWASAVFQTRKFVLSTAQSCDDYHVLRLSDHGSEKNVYSQESLLIDVPHTERNTLTKQLFSPIPLFGILLLVPYTGFSSSDSNCNWKHMNFDAEYLMPSFKNTPFNFNNTDAPTWTLSHTSMLITYTWLCCLQQGLFQSNPKAWHCHLWLLLYVWSCTYKRINTTAAILYLLSTFSCL